MMVDTAKLRGLMAEKNYSYSEMAKKIGVCDKTFYSKMRSGKFGTDEASVLIDALEIKNPCDIFFAQK